MSALDDELDRLHTANRPLRMSETLCVDLPHRVDLGVIVDDTHLWRTIRTWCEDNVRELWTVYTVGRLTDVAQQVYKFTNAQDAMLFKLTWGGKAPPPRRLP